MDKKDKKISIKKIIVIIIFLILLFGVIFNVVALSSKKVKTVMVKLTPNGVEYLMPDDTEYDYATSHVSYGKMFNNILDNSSTLSKGESAEAVSIDAAGFGGVSDTNSISGFVGSNDTNDSAVYNTDAPNLMNDDLSKLVDKNSDYLHWDYYTTIQTTQYDNLVSDVKDVIVSVDGYVEDSNVDSIRRKTRLGDKEYYVRSGQYKIRIPEKSVNKLEEILVGVGQILTNQKVCTDLEQSVTDTDARIEYWTAERHKLEELLNQCENVSEIMEVREKLDEVIWNLDSLATTKKDLKEDINYSTYNLCIEEVIYYEDTVEEYANDIFEGWSYVVKNFLEEVGLSIILLFISITVGIVPLLFVIVTFIKKTAYKIIDYRIKREFELNNELKNELTDN